MNGDALAVEIERELRTLGTPERAKNERAYLRSDLAFLGVTVPNIRAVAKRIHAKHAAIEHDELVALVEALWREPIHERRMVAVELLRLCGPTLEARDIDLIEGMIRESRTWALVDTLAEYVAGGLVEKHKKLARVLDRWARDVDFWVRRAAMLALLGPLRRGEWDFARFGRYADGMLNEREFFIRKAIGWILRETSKRRPDLVSQWLQPRAHRAAGLTLREAVKYLPSEQRERILRLATKKG